MPDRVESFGEVVNSSKNDRLGFIKPFAKLRKIKNLIESRPSRVETDPAGRENGIKLQKEE